MSRVEEIEGAIRDLSAEELRALRVWFADYDWNLWDQQLECDVNAGRLDSLAESALRDHAAGRSTRL